MAGVKRGYSKILIDDLVLPDMGVSSKGAFLDLGMMALETEQRGCHKNGMICSDLLDFV